MITSRQRQRMRRGRERRELRLGVWALLEQFGRTARYVIAHSPHEHGCNGVREHYCRECGILTCACKPCDCFITLP